MITDQSHATRVESNANLILTTLQANPTLSGTLYNHMTGNVPGFPNLTYSAYSRYMRMLHRAGRVKKIRTPGSNRIRYEVIDAKPFKSQEGGTHLAEKVRA